MEHPFAFTAIVLPWLFITLMQKDLPDRRVAITNWQCRSAKYVNPLARRGKGALIPIHSQLRRPRLQFLRRAKTACNGAFHEWPCDVVSAKNELAFPLTECLDLPEAARRKFGHRGRPLVGLDEWRLLDLFGSVHGPKVGEETGLRH